MTKKMIKADDIRAGKAVNNFSGYELKKLGEEAAKAESKEQKLHQREAEDETRRLQREEESEEIRAERRMEDEGVEVVDFVRVQARVSRKNFDYLKREANRTGTNISAIASIYIADGVEAAIKKEKIN